jgi:hypothetical protein
MLGHNIGTNHASLSGACGGGRAAHGAKSADGVGPHACDDAREASDACLVLNVFRSQFNSRQLKS